MSKSKKETGITPIPAVFARPDDPSEVQAKPWTFEESEQGTTDLAQRHMTLPMGEDDQSFGVRSHEMLHAALSPFPSGKMDMCTLAAEDGRIESIATAQGITRTIALDRTDFLSELLESGRMQDAVTCAVAVTGAPQERLERDALAAMGTPEAAELLDLMDWAAGQYAADPSWHSTEIVAGRLREILGEAPPSPSDGQGKPGESGEPNGGDSKPGESGTGESGESDSDASESESGKPGKPASPSSKPGSGLAKAIASKPAGMPGDPDSEPAMPGAHGARIPKPPKPPESDDSASKVAERKHDAKAQPGRPKEVFPVDMEALGDWMSIIEPGRLCSTGKWSRPVLDYPARPVVLVQREHGHKRSRATDYGTVPVRMHRMTIDQKVFASRKHKRQGTVLVDQSSSMRLSSSQIRKLIDYAPAVTVAGYCGNYDGTGTIRVLAAGGRMVGDRDLRPTGRCNEIDGPALAWLAAQRGPRVWVCDGEITTSGDEGIGILRDGVAFSGSGNPLVQQCVRIIQKARITQVPAIMDAVKHLR